MEKTLKRKLSKEEKKELLKLLTYEKVKGKPVYYRDYEKVLKGEIPPEAVTGSSDLQAYTIAVLVAFLYSKIDPAKYLIMTNELGFFTSEDSFRILDIAIFEKKSFKFCEGYTKIPPKVVIEIDTKADLKGYSSVEDYTFEKIQEFINASVEKIIWIFTKPKKIMIAEKGKKWIVQDWDEDFEVMNGIKINLTELVKDYLKEVGNV